VEFKMDKTGNIGVGVGKRSFTAAQILENAQVVLDAVGKAKPAAFKGNYIKTVALSSSHEPGRARRIGRIRQILNGPPTMRAQKQYLIAEVESHLKKSDYVILPTSPGPPWPTSPTCAASSPPRRPSST
jgi:hypothetical protein